MKQRNTEAARLEKDYLTRLEDAISSCDTEDAEEIRQGVKEHVEEAVNAQDSAEVSLVEMAEVLERLGAPEAYAKEASGSEEPRAESEEREYDPAPAPSVGNASGQAELEVDRADWRPFLDKLWIAQLIGVIGLFIPIVDFQICGIISVIMLLFVLKADIVLKSRELRGCKGLLWALLVLLCISPITGLASLAAPLLVIFDLPVVIGLFVVGLVLYWKIMTGLADMVTQYGHDHVARSICGARKMYIVLELLLLMALVVVGVMFGLISRPGKQEQIMLELVLAGVLLPINWVVGWLFILRPISMARKALD